MYTHILKIKNVSDLYNESQFALLIAPQMLQLLGFYVPI